MGEPDAARRSLFRMSRGSCDRLSQTASGPNSYSPARRVSASPNLSCACAHPIQDGQVKAAQLSVGVVFADVVEDRAGLESPSETTGQEQRDLARVVGAPRPHAAREQEAGVVEDRPVPFRHSGEPLGQVGVLADMVSA